MSIWLKRDADGLITVHWRALSTMVEVASHADVDADMYAAAWLKIADSRYGRRKDANALLIYLYLLMDYVLKFAYGYDLDRADMAQLAQKLEPRFLALLPKLASDDRLLERILLGAYMLEEAGERVEDLKLMPAILAALGVLIEETGVTLERVRPQLAKWCEKNRSEFRDIQI